jgi:hypothetical protein
MGRSAGCTEVLNAVVDVTAVVVEVGAVVLTTGVAELEHPATATSKPIARAVRPP